MSRLIFRYASFLNRHLKPLSNSFLYKIKTNQRLSSLNYSNDNKSFFSIQEQSKSNQTSNNANKAELIYEKVANETLESLAEKFDEIGETELDDAQSKDYDVSYSSGVLTVKFPPSIGTYVLNKQTPNLQIWLSSPSSGPKRFDLVEKRWIYKRTGESLDSLLTDEISKCLEKPIYFKI